MACRPEDGLRGRPGQRTTLSLYRGKEATTIGKEAWLSRLAKAFFTAVKSDQTGGLVWISRCFEAGHEPRDHRPAWHLTRA